MSVEQRFIAAKLQGLIKEYGEVIKHVLDECKSEQDAEITEKTPEMIGLEYAKRQAARRALSTFWTKLNSKANDRS